MKTKQGILGIAALLLAAMFTIAGCGNPTTGGPTGGGTTYTYNTPASQTENGVTAAVSFSLASPQLSGTSVTATVNLTGQATAAGSFAVNLTSTKAGLSGASKTLLVTAGQTSFTAQTFAFTVPAQDVDDLALTFNFAEPVNISIASTADWTTALNTINSGGNNKHYILTVNSDISVPGRTSGNFGSVTGLVVTITGGHKLSLSSNGSIFWVVAGQTLIIDGPTLAGKNSNTAPVVYVAGALQLISGAITGNGNTSSYGGEIFGGGVHIAVLPDAQGSFTMSGGTISDNGAPSGGGGVYVAGGTFTKSGGVIYGNAPPDAHANLATDTYGHAVFYSVYNSDKKHIDEYFRDGTLDTGDNISTSQLPGSGIETNWISRQ